MGAMKIKASIKVVVYGRIKGCPNPRYIQGIYDTMEEAKEDFPNATEIGFYCIAYPMGIKEKVRGESEEDARAEMQILLNDLYGGEFMI